MKKILAVFLAVIIGMTACVNAFAASAQKTYISDIVAVTAKDENDAKTQLEKAGYQLLAGSNMNSSLKTGVYLGYKETENADEAITDIAGMNMTGKFSYSDYKIIMEQNRVQIKETIDNFEPVIAEFQVNYEAGKTSALAAYETLNSYKDDDSGMLMGDYLLEYDFSGASNKKMTETFMQANSQIILAIMQQTAFACDDGDDTLIDRMVKTGPNGISKRYMGMFPTVGEANRAMAAEYGDTASEILNDWNSVRNYILEIEENSIKVDANGIINPADGLFETEDRTEDDYKDIKDEEVKAYIETIDTVSDMADITKDEIDFALYNLLNLTEYDGGTLLDFFKRPKNEIKKEELYPLVDAMSEGQRAQFGMNGLLLTLEGALGDVEADTEEAGEAVAEVKKLTGSVGETSIYFGVDRSMFEEGVAFTSAATEHENLTGESWLGKLGVENEETFWLATMIVTSVISCALIGAVLKASSLQKAQIAAEQIRIDEINSAYEPIEEAYNKVKAERSEFDKFLVGDTNVYKNFKREEHYFNGRWSSEFDEESRRLAQAEFDAETNFNSANRTVADPNVGRLAGIVKCVSFVILVVSLAADAFAIYEYITTPDAVEEAIPHHIMSTATTEFGEEYVYYATVKNLSGEAQDTNNHEADAKIGWLTLYATKDKAAGSPILAENLKAQTGSTDFKEGTGFIHLFNETAALNLTDEAYTGAADKVKGTYILFSRDAGMLVGSAITGGNAAIIGVGGLAAGAVIGALLAKLTGKKKKGVN